MSAASFGIKNVLRDSYFVLVRKEHEGGWLTGVCWTANRAFVKRCIRFLTVHLVDLQP